jgi:hypothetical protein
LSKVCVNAHRVNRWAAGSDTYTDSYSDSYAQAYSYSYTYSYGQAYCVPNDNTEGNGNAHGISFPVAQHFHSHGRPNRGQRLDRRLHHYRFR